MNSHQEHTLLQSAGLRIDPATGQVQAGTELLRLGPVNMKVLMLLLESGNRVVSRTEFFDRVWARQLVSDDVLTRSISDLRMQLGERAEASTLIETIPKRGYRWVPPVMRTAGVLPVAATPAESTAAPRPLVKNSIGFRIVAWTGAVLAGLLLLSSSVLWVLGQYSASGRLKVAALPVQATASEQQLATEVDRLLQERLLDSAQIELLSFSATSLHLQNPFPMLAREYGVQYVIEGRVRNSASGPVITLDLVDARSATVVDSMAATSGDAAALQALAASFTTRLGQHLNGL